jgi:2-methylcitrate dehydratase PrpD
MMGMIADLAHYSMSIQLSEVPENVRLQAKLCILDTIGVIVAGTQDMCSRLVLDVERERSGCASESTVLGHSTKSSVEGAARVNAYSGDIFELNDLIGGHVSIGIVPAVLAVAEKIVARGDELVEAVIVGEEVASRVFWSYNPDKKPFTEVGMVAVSFPNSLGAAAAVSRLLKLNEKQTACALAIAGALATWCPSEVIFGDGGTVKPMLFGAAPAVTGIMAALYAQKGMTGPPVLLESEIGFYATAAMKSNPSVLGDKSIWYLNRPKRKMHACCGFIHSAVDVLLALKNEGLLQKAAEIRIGMAQYFITVMDKSEPPVSPNDARFHPRYMWALTASLPDVTSIIPEHSLQFEDYANRPEVVATMKKINIVPENSFTRYEECSVTLLDSSGAVIVNRKSSTPKGTPENPMSADEVREKFRNLVGFKLKKEKIDEYLKLFEDLDKAQDWQWLVRSFD